MQAEIINAISTSVIAFITLIASMFGFYYNLTSIGVQIVYIIVFELMFLGVVLIFMKWITRRGVANA